MKKLRKGIFGLVIVLLFAGLYLMKTTNYSDDYGKSYNKVRKELGILEIPEDWKTQVNGTATKLWMPENMDAVKIGRLGKEVVLDGNKISFERDKIINRTQKPEKGIDISYRFNKEPKFIYEYFEVNNRTYSNQKNLSKDEFDTIIKEWKVE